MSDILVLCQTPYQIIVASQIVKSFYNENNVDIIITDTIVDGEELISRLGKSSLFRNAIYINTKQIKRGGKISPIVNYINKYKEVQLKVKPYIKKYKYKKILFANIDVTIQHIANYLSKYNEIKMLLFEDGLSSYRKRFGEFFNNYKKSKNFISKISYKFLRSRFSNINKFFIFNPQYLEWEPQFSIVEIPFITCNDKLLVEELNKIFNYSNLKNEYSHKFIFFEESYFADDYEVNDLELMKEISKDVGQENVMVKIHPRSYKNRFKELGYFTNTTLSIPWEIIALNMSLDNKVLMTIASGSVLHPFIILGMDIKAIMLFNLKELKGELLGDLIEIIKDICSKNTQNYYIPNNFGELEKYLKEFSKVESN